MSYSNWKYKSGVFLMTLPFVWLTTGLFWLPKGASYMGGVCLISVVCILFKYRTISLVNNVKEDRFLWILGFAFIYAAFLYWYQGYSSRELRALFFSFLFLLLFPLGMLSLRLFIFAATVGVFGACITAVYQYWYMGIPRIHGFINPITYAVFSGLCMVLFFSLFLSEGNKTRKTSLLILSMLAFLVSVSTGARGGLLGIVVAIVAMLGLHAICLRRKKIMGMLFLLGFAGVLVTSHPGFQNRIKDTQKEIDLIKQGDYSSNIGLRFQVWKSAYYSVAKKPLLGFGDAYIEEFKKQGEQGLISKQLYELKFSHYHNQFIDKYMKTGLIGLLLLLLVLGYPLYKALKTPGCAFPKISIVGVVCLVSVSGLTDVPLNHAPIIYCYFFIMSFLLYLLKNSEKLDEARV